MDITLFLAKVIGPFFIIFALALFLHMRTIRAMIVEANTPMLMILTGAISLLLGLLMVASHNTWESLPKCLISLIGWLLVLKGTLRLLTPNFTLALSQKVVDSPSIYCTIALVILIIGVYLSFLVCLT